MMQFTSEMTVNYLSHSGTAKDVVNDARLSYDVQKEALDERDEKLLDYLCRHGHLTPFNSCFLRLRLEVPIFVARQLVKHEYLPMSEVSRRYVKSNPVFYIPPFLRKSVADKKQGSGDNLSEWANRIHQKYLKEHCGDCQQRYQFMLETGICEEQARMVLPLNTMTTVHMKGMVAAWAKLVRLRTSLDSQYEIQRVALKIDEIGYELWPAFWAKLVEAQE